MKSRVYFAFLFLAATLMQAAGQEIKMTVEPSGARTVPCSVSGLPLRFAISNDSSEGQLALPDATFMLRNGFIKPKDIAAGKVDGQIAAGDTVTLRDIKIGDKTIKRLQAAVSDTLSTPLRLGSAALNRLGSHTVYGDLFVIATAKTRKARRRDTALDRGRYFNAEGEEVKPGFTGDGLREHNGTTYRGHFTNGVLSGFAEITYASGDVYEGETADDKPNGHGRFAWMNNDRFEGEFRDGKKCGRGILVYADSSRYEGEWVDDERSGHGMIIWPDGERYEGAFVKGKRQGQGRFLWSNGDEYDGEWVNNRREGNGILRSKEGGWTYEGEFCASRRNGTGRIVWESGDIYKGDFKNDQRTGNGTLWLENGDRYEGEFLDGYFYGHGTYFYKDGNSFEGEWVDDMREGPGKFRFADGTWYTGTWRDDRLVDKHETH